MNREFWTVLAPADANSLGLAGRAVELAGERGLCPCAVLVGTEPEAMLPKVFARGIEKAYLLELDAENINYERPCCRCLTALIRDKKPEAVLFEYSVFTSSIAPAIAAALRRGITADCTELMWDDTQGLLQIRPTFGGRETAVNVSKSVPYIATVRKGVFGCKKTAVRTSAKTVVRLTLDDAGEEPFELLKVLESTGSTSELTGAKIVLSGGIGLGSRENFEKLFTLARLTGAAVGASRAAVAAGYASYMHQVGQTGVSVNPELYIAFGISGAVQHLSGIMGANRIVAVNTDPEAPIHSCCDCSVIADCVEVLDSLILHYTNQ